MGSETKVIIGGDASGAVNAARQAGDAYKTLGKTIGEVQAMASKALAFGGLSVSAAEVIKLADNYGQLTSRLQLATRYTGDYADVQAALSKAAKETRTSLTDTTDMYTKMAPALQAVGKTGSQSIGIIKTISQAIMLSGVSGEAASAGIMQFTQALGSGKLAGDELRSILENTPGLADALAEGLGKTRGELKQLGADGKLTTDVLIAALEKVAARVNEDFASLPLTVGQAMTLLMNNITEIIGGGAQATGVMAALARVLVHVSDGMKVVADSTAGAAFGKLFSELAQRVVAMDAGFRALVKTSLAFYNIMTSPWTEARSIWKAYREDLSAIEDETLQFGKNTPAIIASAQQQANKRLDIEKQLQDKVIELTKLRAVKYGEASADILLNDTARTDAQIKNAEKLRDALSAAWKQSVTDAAAAGEAAKTLFAKAGDIRQTGDDKANAKLRSTLTPAEQQQQIQGEFASAASAATQSAGLATIAALHGRLESATKLTAQAEKDAERAARFADQIDDPLAGSQAIKQAAEIQASIAEAQAKTKLAEQKSLQERATSQAALIADLDKQLSDLQTKAASLKVEVETKAASSAIDGLRLQLEQLQDKTVTVTVNQVGSTNAPISGADPLPGTGGAFAYGGYTGPGGKWQPAGIVHAGEFVHRQEVVRQPGALAFLARFNEIGMAALNTRGYAHGGLVNNLSMPFGASRQSSAPASNLTLVLPGGGGSYQVSAEQSVLNELTTAVQRETLKRGLRK